MSDLLYCENPEWADVSPIPQDDGPNPLVPIAYSKECNVVNNSVCKVKQNLISFYIDSDAMDYFRAVTRTNEKSQRVLTLIQNIIDMNPAHYTVW
jgi:protein farnesyltransferase/geranylgeranyltransferase type-1 subunit alpha